MKEEKKLSEKFWEKNIYLLNKALGSGHKEDFAQLISLEAKIEELRSFLGLKHQHEVVAAFGSLLISYESQYKELGIKLGLI